MEKIQLQLNELSNINELAKTYSVDNNGIHENSIIKNYSSEYNAYEYQSLLELIGRGLNGFNRILVSLNINNNEYIFLCNKFYHDLQDKVIYMDTYNLPDREVFMKDMQKIINKDFILRTNDGEYRYFLNNFFTIEESGDMSISNDIKYRIKIFYNLEYKKGDIDVRR